MKHTNIAKVLGIAEVEDLQEGFHLQPEEAATVDAFIATAQVTQENFAALSIAAGALENNIVELKAAAVNTAATVSTQAARIVELEAENARLGALPSGKGTTVTGKVDENEEPKEVPSYLADDNPINAFADKRLRKK